MAAKIAKSHQRDNQDWIYRFHCPGCDCSHFFSVPGWRWSGGFESPTVRPSILVNGHKPLAPGMKRCHSFVTDGKIQFLSDCDHMLADKTVDLPNVDEDENTKEVKAMTLEEAIKKADELLGKDCFVESDEATNTFYVGKMPKIAGMYIGFMGHSWEEALKLAEEHYSKG